MRQVKAQGRPIIKIPFGDGKGYEQDKDGPMGFAEAGRQDDLLSYLWRRELMGEDRNGLPNGLEEDGRQDELLSYMGIRVRMVEDRNDLLKGLEEDYLAGRPFKLPVEKGKDKKRTRTVP